MNKTVLLDEQDFLSKIGTALDIMGFDTSLVEAGEYPVSLEGKLPGYEDLPLNFVLIFLPVQDVFDNQTQALQIYFSLYDYKISEDKFDILTTLFNRLNTSTVNGVFGVQCDIAEVCYKQAVLFPAGIDMDNALSIAMQNLLVMALALDKHYDSILAIIED